jgi:ascorbate-specific PTS system EIIC-type component UlaA
MGLGSLALFMTGMWAMVLAVAAFLVAFVAPIGFYLFGSEGNRVTVSAIQATIAIVVVIALVFGLSRMKRIYLQRKLRP